MNKLLALKKKAEKKLQGFGRKIGQANERAKKKAVANMKKGVRY